VKATFNEAGSDDAFFKKQEQIARKAIAAMAKKTKDNNLRNACYDSLRSLVKVRNILGIKI